MAIHEAPHTAQHMCNGPYGRVSDELRADRLKVGLSQAQLAGRAGCSLGYISAIEAGAAPRGVTPVIGRIRAVLAAAQRDTQTTEGSTDE